MTLVSSRGLIRASKNPACELLSAMALEAPNEKRFYEQVMGEPYLGEYGERLSARRRGAQFEANNHASDAARLKEMLAPLVRRDPSDMYVRNFVEEFPGPINQIHAARLHRVREVLKDLKAGRRVPDLIIQPTLALRVIDAAAAGCFYISPDFILYDAQLNTYRVGEEKSFIVRDRTTVDPRDLDNTRRQSAVGVLALADELSRMGLPVPSDPVGLFVFATPFGLKPAPAHEEPLRGEIAEVRRGIDSMRAAARKLVQLRRQMPSPLPDLIDEFGVNYRESCVGSCLLAARCEKLDAANPARYGDAAVRVLGSVRVDDLCGVLRADPATLTREEIAVQQRFRESAGVLRLTYDELVRMIA